MALLLRDRLELRPQQVRRAPAHRRDAADDRHRRGARGTDRHRRGREHRLPHPEAPAPRGLDARRDPRVRPDGDLRGVGLPADRAVARPHRAAVAGQHVPPPVALQHQRDRLRPHARLDGAGRHDPADDRRHLARRPRRGPRRARRGRPLRRRLEGPGTPPGRPAEREDRHHRRRRPRYRSRPRRDDRAVPAAGRPRREPSLPARPQLRDGHPRDGAGEQLRERCEQLRRAVLPRGHAHGDRVRRQPHRPAHRPPEPPEADGMTTLAPERPVALTPEERREAVQAAARGFYRRKQAYSRFFVATMALGLVASLGVLFAILESVISKGLPYLSWKFLTSLPLQADLFHQHRIGGISSALTGTVVVFGLAFVIAVPLAVVVAIALYESQGKVMSAFRTLLEVMVGMPSILFGIFIFAYVVHPNFWHSGYVTDGLAGSLALAVLMLPLMAVT